MHICGCASSFIDLQCYIKFIDELQLFNIDLTFIMAERGEEGEQADNNSNAWHINYFCFFGGRKEAEVSFWENY